MGLRYIAFFGCRVEGLEQELLWGSSAALVLCFQLLIWGGQGGEPAKGMCTRVKIPQTRGVIVKLRVRCVQLVKPSVQPANLMQKTKAPKPCPLETCVRQDCVKASVCSCGLLTSEGYAVRQVPDRGLPSMSYCKSHPCTIDEAPLILATFQP